MSNLFHLIISSFNFSLDEHELYDLTPWNAGQKYIEKLCILNHKMTKKLPSFPITLTDRSNSAPIKTFQRSTKLRTQH